MLQAILVTELEKAIIEKLRNEHDSMKCIVLMTLGLPFTNELLEYSLCLHDKDRYKFGSTDDEIRKRKNDEIIAQEKRLNSYRKEGYKGLLELGTGKATPFLRSLPCGK